jgi:hypothetical protein
MGWFGTVVLLSNFHLVRCFLSSAAAVYDASVSLPDTMCCQPCRARSLSRRPWPTQGRSEMVTRSEQPIVQQFPLLFVKYLTDLNFPPFTAQLKLSLCQLAPFLITTTNTTTTTTTRATFSPTDAFFLKKKKVKHYKNGPRNFQADHGDGRRGERCVERVQRRVC